MNGCAQYEEHEGSKSSSWFRKRPYRRAEWDAHDAKTERLDSGPWTVGSERQELFPGLSQSDLRKDLFEPLDEAIERSSFIATLEDGWDDQGSPAIRPATWRRAVSFLRASAAVVLSEVGVVIDIPEITPGPGGSVDIHWQRAGSFMLINVRPDGPSDFYGETVDGLFVKGNFQPETHHFGVLSWLKNQTR